MTQTPVTRLITEWQSTRAQLAELERAEHLDITDAHGRVWTWKSGAGDIYTHDGMAFPGDWLKKPGRIGLPSQTVLDNPNYDKLCTVCLDGRERNAPKCHPEWNCSHKLCQS
jgi:hypothetical protein